MTIWPERPGDTLLPQTDQTYFVRIILLKPPPRPASSARDKVFGKDRSTSWSSRAFTLTNESIYFNESSTVALKHAGNATTTVRFKAVAASVINGHFWMSARIKAQTQKVMT